MIETYEIGNDDRGQALFIKCKRCRWVSYNRNDIEQRYCGHCHIFHDDIWPPAREWWLKSYAYENHRP